MDHRVKPGDDDFNWCESGVAPGAASWLTASAGKPGNACGAAAESLKFDAY
jgi:hypothetical protein